MGWQMLNSAHFNALNCAIPVAYTTCTPNEGHSEVLKYSVSIKSATHTGPDYLASNGWQSKGAACLLSVSREGGGAPMATERVGGVLPLTAEIAKKGLHLSKHPWYRPLIAKFHKKAFGSPLVKQALVATGSKII